MKRILNRKIGNFPKTVGEIPKTYLESLTYEEQLIWFCKNLKQVIDNSSSQNEEIEQAIKYMKDNIDETTINEINRLVNENKIYINTIISYNEENEEITIGGEVSNE